MNLGSEEELVKSRIKRHKAYSEELKSLVEDALDLKRWGFQLTYTHIDKKDLPHIIFNSTKCRVRFSYVGGDSNIVYIIKVYYGRLHAANDKYFMDWKGKQCRCWHDVNRALWFLDGLTPQEAVDQLRIEKWPHVIEKYRNSRLGKQLEHDNRLEWMVRMHASIWKHYGNKMFEIYDLDRLDLWDQYTNYLRSYAKILGTSPYPGTPGNDLIC